MAGASKAPRSPRKPAFFDFGTGFLARQKGPEDDVSAQRPEIPRAYSRKKAAFLHVGSTAVASEDLNPLHRETGYQAVVA
jgi:hypothetical protein